MDIRPRPVRNKKFEILEQIKEVRLTLSKFESNNEQFMLQNESSSGKTT